MKKILFLAMTLATFSGNSFAQAPDETIEADPYTGTGESSGVIFVKPASGGGGGSAPGGETGGGGSMGSDSGMTVEIVNETVDEKTKDQKNQIEKDKVKKIDKVVKLAKETGKELAKLFRDTLAAAAKITGSLSWVSYETKPVFNNNGEFATGTNCTGLALDINANGAKGRNPCVEINQSVQQIIKPNGQRMNMISVYYRVVDYCYVTRKCPETAFSFTVVDEAELTGIFDEIASVD